MPSATRLVDVTKRAEDERKIRVVLADDDLDIRDGVSTYLSATGFEVIAAVEDGIEAFESSVSSRISSPTSLSTRIRAIRRAAPRNRCGTRSAGPRRCAAVWGWNSIRGREHGEGEDATIVPWA
jgi:hypothetical protein